MRGSKIVLAIVGLLCFTSGARAWDMVGHQLVTELAIKGLPDDFPAWVRDDARLARLLYLAPEPDRWRGQGAAVLNHINSPDHYMDLEDLDVYGLTVEKLPRFRNEFIEQLATFRAQHPDIAPYDPTRDAAHVYSTPGLIPYAIIERYWKLVSCWSTLRTLEKYSDVVSAADIESARNNVIQEMGLLSHFVGDAHQPLHMSKHHHGWKGENPEGYTTNRGIHDYVDGTALVANDLNAKTLAGQIRPAAKIDALDPWEQILKWMSRTKTRVEPLYKLEKLGKLEAKSGHDFFARCVLEGGSNLAGLWVAAYKASKIDDYMSANLEALRAINTPVEEEAPTSK